MSLPLARLLAVGVTSCASAACGHESARPSSVPAGVVQVTFSKDGGWAHCWVDIDIQLNRCRTYDWRGQRVYRFGHETDPDDVFLKYEGQGPVAKRDLRIDSARTQPHQVWLENGVILLPRNDFQTQKQDVDEVLRLRREKESK